MTMQLITDVTVEPVTVAEAKAHCRVDVSDDDALIGALITVARQVGEHITGRAFAPQTREVVLDLFPDAIELPGGATVVSSVKYYDTTGAEVTLSASDYVVDSIAAPAWVLPAYGKSWPETYQTVNAVRVRYTCGFTTAPTAIKQWILMRVASMYDNRADFATARDAANVALPFVDHLLDPYKVVAI